MLRQLARNKFSSFLPELSVETGLAERSIFDVLVERERLGSTGVGKRVAIPHGRIPLLTSLLGIFFRLDRAVEFDSIDNEPVV